MYLSAPLRGWDGRSRIETRSSHLVRRSSSTGKWIAIGIVFGLILLIAVVAICIVRTRKSRTKRQALDGELQKTSFWSGFFNNIRPRTQYEPASAEDRTETTTQQSHPLNPTRSRETPRNAERGNTRTTTTTRNQSSAAAAAVDRNTSVRSVMTLPAYRQMANTNEQVLGREGERDGVDVILDLPTAEEDETLRDEEMAALYQIRLTRRQQIAEREERREQRREARRQHDTRALADIRARTVAANSDTTVTDLRAQVDRIKETRQRSVSSVSYADVGIARHDGTRIRANSSESERVGLLSDAASIAQSSRRSGETTLTGHQRGRSASSAASIDSDFPSPFLTRSRGDSQTTIPRPVDGGQAGSSPELIEADLGDETMPPPEYVDVSLDDARSTTPIAEPPPDYPGPYRSASQRTQRTERDLASTSHDDESEERDEVPPMEGTGISSGGIPRLPSLRISHLPQIVIEPSSAHPASESHEA